MRIAFEQWQLAQMERLAATQPYLIERVMNACFEADPSLLDELVIGAVHEEQISIEMASRHLNCSEEIVEAKLSAHRRRTLKQHCVVICEGAVAKIADGGVPIWEIVRVHRRLGSLEKLCEAFTGVSQQMLSSALDYAKLNPEEIETQITRYEELLERKRAEYPYAR